MLLEKTKSTILITGVAGLIGNSVSKFFLNNGYTVYGIDNLSGGYKEFIDNRVIFTEADLIGADLVNNLFESIRPDYVLHFAAYAAEGLSPYIRNFNYNSNVICSVNVINNCVNHKVKKIIFSSSMAVYGHQKVPFIEMTFPAPSDPYGIAKFCVEMDLAQAAEHFGLRYSILRPHNVIGKYQNIWDKYRNVIGIWIREILNGNDICIFGDGEQTRAFSDVKYLNQPIINLLDGFDGEIFNIGSDKYYSINEVATILQSISQKYGYHPNIKHIESRLEVKHAYCDHTKAKTLLKFEDETDLTKLMEEMFIWAKDIVPKEVRTLNYEIITNMYSSWKK